MNPIRLSEEAIRAVNEALSRGKSVEIATRGGKLVVWECTSKKKYEVTVTGQ